MPLLSKMSLKFFSNIKKLRNLWFALRLGIYDNTGEGIEQGENNVIWGENDKSHC